MSEKFLKKLRRYVDGEADSIFEYVMLFVVIVNVISLGLETSPVMLKKYGSILFAIDQGCLWIFIVELLIKVIAYNKKFFGEQRIGENGEKFFHINKWTNKI